MIDVLLENRETQPIHYYCVAINSHRYDFTVIYSKQFFDKAMVISIQTGKMALMCQEDIGNNVYWADQLGIYEMDIENCKTFLKMILNKRIFADQY